MLSSVFFFLMIRRPPRSTLDRSSAASDVYKRQRKISELKGLQKVAPVFAAAFTLVMLSSIGVPGLNGFVGEFMVLIGSFGTARWYVAVAATGVILAALYLLWAYQRVFHTEPDEANRDFAELKWKEGMLLLPFIGLIVFCGVYPKPLIDRIQPAVDALLEHVELHSDWVTPQPPGADVTVEVEAETDGEQG